MAESISQQIRDAAIARGIDPEVALKIANAESDLVSSAKNPRSSARGLFQVTDDTWKFYGGDPKKRNDVAENIRVGLKVIDSNRAEYKRRFGREPSQSELYTMHVFGKTGGPMVLSSDPNTELKELLSPKVLKANPQFKRMTVAELSESMRKKMKEPAAAAPKAPVTAGPAVAPATPKETIRPQAPVKQVAEESAPKRPEMSRDFLASMGPSYMAALAASTLGDLSEDREEGETDEDYIERITQERLAAQEEPAVAAPQRLLQAELSYQSPFETEEPVKLAFGGLPYKPSAMLPSDVKTKVATAQQEWDAYNKAAADYNRRVDEYNNLLNQYNSAFVQYQGEPVTYYAAGRGNITPTTSQRGLPTFHTSQQGKTYTPVDVGGGNFLIRTGEFMKMAAPREPGGGPSQPSSSAEQVQAAVDLAKAKQRRLQFVYDVLEDPERYNLSIPKLFATGGYVKRADGSPVYGEIATGEVTPDTRAALSLPQGLSASDAFNTLRRIYGEGMSNLETGLRASTAAIPGMVGDIGQAFNIPYLRRAPSTEELLQRFPQRVTQRTEEAPGFEDLGASLPLPIPPSMIKGTAKAMMAGVKAAKPSTETVRDIGPAVEATVSKVAPAAKPMSVVEQTTATVAEGMRPLDQMFVSKVDDFITGQKNPLTKQQLLGQMRGKFRDYEIGRVEQALADLPDTAKIMPQDLSARVSKTYPTSNLRTTIIEPKKYGLHNTLDNPYGDRLVGSVNLSLPVAEQAKELSKNAEFAESVLANAFNGDVKAIELDTAIDFLKKEGLSSDYKGVMKALDKIKGGIRQLDKDRMAIDDLYKAVEYPTLHSKFDDIWKSITNKYVGRPYEEKRALAREELRKEALKTLKELKVPIPKGMDINSEAFKTFAKSEASLRLTMLKDEFSSAAKAVEKGILEERTALNQKLREKLVYYGQHKGITPEGENVAFSRFVDHETVLPDIGKAKVMHFAELQSDRLDDLWKRGSKSGSKEKDLAEVADLTTKIKNISANPKIGEAIDKIRKVDRVQYATPLERSEAIQSVVNSYPDQKKELIEFLKLSDREAKLRGRIKLGDYRLEEAFAGMEKSPQVVQQLMIKNAIGAAMQRGVNVITFPGKESAQAQLYEKLPANLKQVVKDLGPGFEIRPIELYDDKGNPFTHVGLVWDDKTAQRILKEGIRFNKGGMVDKNDLDYARYI
jgi:hypothetical protein